MPRGAYEIFGDNLARFGHLAKFLPKNECSRHFKTRGCKINGKRYLSECSRTTGEIVNFARQAVL